MLLRGEAGIGKTRLAEQAAAAVGTVLTIRGSTGLSAVPFGALSPMLARLQVSGTQTDAMTLAELHVALAADADVVVVVDDVPRLDPSSIAVVEQLVRATTTPVALTARDGEPLPEAIQKLLDDGSLEIHPVLGLEAPDIERLVELLLGGPVHPTTLRTVTTESGGVPLVIHELVAGAAAAGMLHHGRHGWEMPGVVANRRLIDLVEARFAGLEPPSMRILELLAAGQPLPLAVLDERVVEALEASDLVIVEASPDAVDEVRLGHPLYDDVLRAMAPAVRWRRRQREASALLADAGDEDRAFRGAALALEAGAPLDLDRAERAARRAASRSDYRLARSLAEVVLTERPDAFGALLARGAALAAEGDDEARAVLSRAAEVAADDEQRALAAHRAGMYLALRAERVVEAIAVCEHAVAAITAPEWRQFVAADLVKWRMMDGRVGELPTSDAPVAVGAARLNQCMIEALVGTMSGDLTGAEAAVVEGLPLARVHRAELPNAEDLLQLSRFLGRAFSGDLAGARLLGEQQLRGRGDREDEQIGMWSYALGMVALHAGRAGRAAELATAAITHLEWRDFTGLRPVARALRATALAQRGRLGEARSGLEQVPDASLADPKVALQCAQAEAWLLVADGRRGDAVARLAAAGRAGIASGHEMLGALTSYEAVRLGGADAVREELAALAAARPGTVVADLSAHAAAYPDDAEALLSVAERLATVGLPTAAADAAAQAAEAHARAGRETRARAALRRSVAYGSEADGARGVDGATSPLTPREREVAVAAASRLRSREIAARLGVSPRTVDNHLARIYRKLEVRTRDELAEALADLGLIAGGRSDPAVTGSAVTAAGDVPGGVIG